jgi:hypothetical protein
MPKRMGRVRYRKRSDRRADALIALRPRFIMSRAELAFYRVLSLAVTGRCSISLKTRLADVVDCPDSMWRKPLGRRLAQKHVDFVLYDPTTATIHAVIELDDATHDLPARRRRDLFVDGLLERARIPLLRVRWAPTYSLPDLSDSLRARLPQLWSVPASNQSLSA